MNGWSGKTNMPPKGSFSLKNLGQLLPEDGDKNTTAKTKIYVQPCIVQTKSRLDPGRLYRPSKQHLSRLKS